MSDATYNDTAIANAFPHGLSASVASGARGAQVVAVQYALGRLGYLNSLADGSYGPQTAAAVSAFQRSHVLPVTGAVDATMLAALDGAVAAYDGRTPASRAADPLAYLSDFAARGISTITVADRSHPLDWSHPEIRASYGRFVEEYWEVLKQNRVEADCKTLALFFMDRFRAKVQADLGVTLHTAQTPHWAVATVQRPLGYFQRVDHLIAARSGYEAVAAIERLDPKHTMLEGVNLSAGGIDANQVGHTARAVEGIEVIDNRGDRGKPEVPVQKLDAGMVLFLNHGDGRWDHTVNVVKVTRDGAGRVQQLVLAVGSFDDMKDSDHATAPRGPFEIDSYAEEVTVDVDVVGAVTSRVTWSSEPRYEVAPRYDATNTIMDMHPGASLKVARWG